MKATEKQVGYALSLLSKAGYSTKWMNSSFKALGVSMRERSGKVSEDHEAAEDERNADQEEAPPTPHIVEEIRFGECLSDGEMIAVTNTLMRKWGI